MNCPKCDLQTLPDQKFCRSCGASLHALTRPLAELATVSDSERTPAINSQGEQQRTNRLTLWSFIILFIGIAIGLTGKMLLHDEIVTVVGVLVSIAGMFLAAYPFLSPARPKKYDSIPSPQPEVLTQPQSTNYLPPEGRIEHIPSITEGTTGLLKNSAPTRTRKKED